MKLPDSFESYVKKGTMIRSAINRPRARFLIDESQKTFNSLIKRLDIIGIDEDNANSIVKDCYKIF